MCHINDFPLFLSQSRVPPHCDECLRLSSCLLSTEICPRPSGSAWLQALLHLAGVVVRRASHGRRGTGELCRLRLRPSVTHRPTGMRVCHRWEWPFFPPPPRSCIINALRQKERLLPGGTTGRQEVTILNLSNVWHFSFSCCPHGATRTLSWGLIVTRRAEQMSHGLQLEWNKALRVAESATRSGRCQCEQMTLPVLVPF